MKYTCYTFRVVQSEAEISEETVFDLLSEELANLDFECFEREENKLLAYVQSELDQANAIAEITENFIIPTIRFSYEAKALAEENWNEEWEKHYFQPIILADGKCCIRAPFHPELPEVSTEIIINPKMAFGTGNHETTSLIISYILEHNVANLDVLDMGCGTGILGILALKKGAKSLVSIDIDEWAYQNVSENAELNNVKINQIIQGDASALKDLGEFDLILANITRNVLLNDLGDYAQSLKIGGRIVLSGFYSEDIPCLIEKGKEYNLLFSNQKIENNWSMLELIKA